MRHSPSLVVVSLAFSTLWGCAEERLDKTPRFDATAADVRIQVEAIARDHLANGRWLDDIDEVEARRTFLDRQGTAHIRLDQRHRGIPVLGGQMVVHVPSDGTPVHFTDRLLHGLTLDVQPMLTEDEAIRRAREHAQRGDADVAEVALHVLRQRGVDHLAWRVGLRDLASADPGLPVAFVDAQSGRVVLAYDDLQTARNRETYDANSSSSIAKVPDRAELTPPIGDASVDDAHDFVGTAWDYYDSFQQRDSFDDAGATVISVVDIGPNFTNAFWDGTILGYGDSGNSSLAPFSQSLDVVAHEFTHAVTDSTADLVYAEESGGLNEATSDIMAAVIEAWNDGWVVTNNTWFVGEDLGGVFRNMANPTSVGTSIDSYLNYNANLDVHQTSGIANRAFVEWVADPSLNIEEAGDIWYQALAAYMTPRTTFAEARTATQQAALDLFGPGAEVLAVSDGWDLVDVSGTPAYALFDDVGPLALTAGQQGFFNFTPDPNAVAVRFMLVGDNGDADLYVSLGTTPTTTTYDCRSVSPTSRESCTFDPSGVGTYQVLVDAFATFSDLRLYAWEAVPNGGPCSDLDQDGVTTCDGDCDDSLATVFPGAAETCNGLDDDCNGVIDDPGTPGLTPYYADLDGDGFGDPGSETLACTAPDDAVPDATDCDDTNRDVNPDADERCNTIDDNCNGDVDENPVDLPTWYTDADNDGYGDPQSSTQACIAPTGTVADGTDCNDGVTAINPGADELCNQIDDDCDTVVDPPTSQGAPQWFRDADGDGFGDLGTTERACVAPTGFVAVAGDCNDGSMAVNPNAAEVCNQIDDDCDAVVDPPQSVDAQVWYVDADNDGYGNASQNLRACVAPAGHVDIDGDCNDLRNDIHPGADEVCDAANVDEDCDAVAEEAGAIGEQAFWLDVDGDGFGDAANEVMACDLPPNAVEPTGLSDCDDGADGVFPGATEVCDGIDQDCNDAIDDDAVDAQTFYIDADGDGFGSEAVEACDPPDGTVTEPGDCDDADPDVNPEGIEVPNDGVDQDCDDEDLVVEEPDDPSDPDGEPNDLPERGSAPDVDGGCSTGGFGASWPLGMLAFGLLMGRRRRS
ncbi:MAG: MopE-related protein [Myxococcota bacterium]